jgi:hypothetical protein
MKNLFIKYELAVLAQEKGFDEECIACYDKNNLLATYTELFYPKNYNNDAYCISAPLYQQLVDWFIKEHNLFPSYDGNHSGWSWAIYKSNGTHIKSMDECKEDYCKTHYEALSKALTEAFKLI